MAHLSRRSFLMHTSAGLAALGALGAAGCRTRPLQGADVLVLGAGFAGVSAARELARLGARPIVLEARNRIGGRAFTDTSLGTALDIGASWFHEGFDNPMRREAKAAGVAFQEADYWNTLALPSGDGQGVSATELFNRTHADAVLNNEFGKILRTLPTTRSANGGPMLTVGEAWKAVAPHLGDPLAACVIRDVTEMRFAADLNEVSILGLLNETELNADPRFLPRGEALVVGGMQRVAEHIGRGLDVRLEHEVQKIRWDARGVEVSTSRGVFNARAAVVTFSVGVLQSRQDLFEPALPAEHAAALGRMKMGLLGKVGIVFPEVSWPAAPEYWVQCDGSPCSSIINLAAYGQRPAFMGLANGQGSHRLEALSDEEAGGRFRRQLEHVLGIRLPDPVGTRVTRWGSDPFSLGSYAVSAPGSIGNEAKVLSEPVGGVLALAGEAYTVRDAHTVHGAAKSGERAARRLMGLAAG